MAIQISFTCSHITSWLFALILTEIKKLINIVPIKTSFKCNIKILKTEQPIISGNFSFSFVTVKLKKRVCWKILPNELVKLFYLI